MQRAARKAIQSILMDPSLPLAKITPHPFSHAYGCQVTFETILQHNREGIDLVSLIDGKQVSPAATTAVGGTPTPKVNPLVEFVKAGHVVQNSSYALEKKAAAKRIPVSDAPSTSATGTAAAAAADTALPGPVTAEDQMLEHVVRELQYNKPRNRSLRDVLGIAAKPADREGGHVRMSSIAVAKSWIEKKENQPDYVPVGSRRPRGFFQ